MIYLDNAATSFPKPKSVIKEVSDCLNKYCGNPGRGSHALALAAADKIFDTRVSVAELLGYAKCENVIFAPNATYALNLVIKGLISKKCHCIVSDLEHNSVLRPLYKCINKFGGEISVFNTDLPLRESIAPLIRADTGLIICTLCSNVTGKSLDIRELSEIARENNLKLVIDASQYLGHRNLNLKDLYFTALCCAGHKGLFGIQGSAFTVINDTDLMDTLCEGGSGIDSFAHDMPIWLPERYEAGTLSTPSIASLYAGISFINQVGIGNIEKHLTYLTALLTDELSKINAITLYGAENGIISFNLGSYNSSLISDILDKSGVATRSGFHCAPLVHEKLGTTERGAVRVSLSYFNTPKDVYTLTRILNSI